MKFLYKLSTWPMVWWLPSPIFLFRGRSTQTQWLTKNVGPGNLASQTEKLYSRAQLTCSSGLSVFSWKSGNYLIRENFIPTPLTEAKLLPQQGPCSIDGSWMVWPRWNLMVSMRLLHCSISSSAMQIKMTVSCLVGQTQGCSCLPEQYYPWLALL